MHHMLCHKLYTEGGGDGIYFLFLFKKKKKAQHLNFFYIKIYFLLYTSIYI